MHLLDPLCSYLWPLLILTLTFKVRLAEAGETMLAVIAKDKLVSSADALMRFALELDSPQDGINSG